jgi:hypothetical protein
VRPGDLRRIQGPPYASTQHPGFPPAGPMMQTPSLLRSAELVCAVSDLSPRGDGRAGGWDCAPSNMPIPVPGVEHGIDRQGWRGGAAELRACIAAVEGLRSGAGPAKSGVAASRALPSGIAIFHVQRFQPRPWHGVGPSDALRLQHARGKKSVPVATRGKKG